MGVSGVMSRGAKIPAYCVFRQLGDFPAVTQAMGNTKLSWFDLPEPSNITDTVGCFSAAAPDRITVPSGFSFVEMSAQVMISSVAVPGALKRFWVGMVRSGGDNIGLTDSLPLVTNAVPENGFIAVTNIATGVIPTVAGEQFSVTLLTESTAANALVQGDECWWSIKFY